jgi:hypothetical protein
MRIIHGLLFFLGIVGAFAGTGTLLNVSGGKVQTSHVNQYFTALNQDFVPRNSSGIATDLGGNLGQSTLRWSTAYANILQIGANADNLTIDDNSTQMRFKVGGVDVFDLNGSGIANAGIISTANLAANAVTRPKLVAVGAQTSSSCGNGTYTNATTSYTAVTSLNVTITTTGRPVILMMVSDGTGNQGAFICSSSSSAPTDGCFIQIQRGVTDIADDLFNIGEASASTTMIHSVPPGAFNHIDSVSAGTYTYTVYGKAQNASNSLACDNVRLVAYEL